jgi:prepilin-type N-terminal cleavage/methylation domain-containing protein
MRSADRISSRRPRRGFTIVEVLVALGILALGLLALAGTSAGLARADADARLTSLAASMLAERVERVAAGACVDSSGVRATRDVVEWWRTSTDSGALRLVDSTRWTQPGVGPRVVGVNALVACAR